jgi:acyl dehydratase
MDPIRSFDALAPGMSFELGGFSLSRGEIVEFAGRYDAQPFHMDEEAGRASVFGGLVASGLHTLSAAVGHMIRSGLLAEVSQGGGAMEVKWPAPVRPDERLAMRIEVAETRRSASKPALGIARLRYLVTREADGLVVMEVLATHFMRR